MAKPITAFVGLDLGDKTTEVCVLDGAGAVVARRTVRTTRQSLLHAVAGLESARIAIEVGCHSRWVEATLVTTGHEVVVANPRQVRLIWKRPRKTDKSDALVLAKLARLDVALLAPVHHRCESMQVDLATLKARDVLVRIRSKLVTHVRGSLKSFGVRIPDSTPTAFPGQAAEVMPANLAHVYQPALELVRELTQRISAFDKAIENLAATSYPQAARCTQVPGVGTLTGLAFLLTVGDPGRFKRSRFAAAFLGLTPGKDQSGASDPQRRITKAGDPFVRRLMVQSAHYILGPFGPDSDLRRWGLRLAERGGGNGKKRAIVAVARKVAVLLHRLLVTGATFQPTGHVTQPSAA